MPVSGGHVADFASKFMRALDVDATTGGLTNVSSGRVTGLVLANFAAPINFPSGRVTGLVLAIFLSAPL